MSNWALLNLCYSPWEAGLYIRAVTDVPCHLSVYWTDKEPLKHHVSAILRGLLVPWDTYFCFVAWTEVEQNEAGDTLFHTFSFPTWPSDHLRYFTFAGTISAVDSPSRTAIFNYKHPGFTPLTYDIRPRAPGFDCTIREGVPFACPDHWKNVNEEVCDGDASYVAMIGALPWGFRTDYYQCTAVPFSRISGLTLTGCLRREGGDASHRVFMMVLITHGLHYFTAQFSGSTAYSLISFHYPVNPFTLLPWTKREVDLLEIGVSIRIIAFAGGSAYGFCSQLFARIHQDICVPEYIQPPAP